jgi:alkanesulfonate monooxygenase SsuD/methylene tetrahydromethanopterin reductase-like flavin-dependent oxidoreductase (luciferase family)
MQILAGLWTTPQGDPFGFEGRFWQLEEARNFPVLVQKPRPEIVIGGTGPRRTPLMAAKWADEFNSGAGHGCAERFANVRRVCEEIGRDPSTLRMSATAQVICGATRAEAQQRLERLGEPGRRMLANGTVGTPSDLVGELERLGGEGCETVYLHIFDIDDLDHLALIGSEVVPQVA